MKVSVEAPCCFLPSCLLFPPNCSLPGKWQPLALSLQPCPPHTEPPLHYQADRGAGTKETSQRLAGLQSSWTPSASQAQASLREFQRVSLVNLSILWPPGNISLARTRWPRDSHECTRCSLPVMASTWAELRANSSWSHMSCVTALGHIPPGCRRSTNKGCLSPAFILSPPSPSVRDQSTDCQTGNTGLSMVKRYAGSSQFSSQLDLGFWTLCLILHCPVLARIVLNCYNQNPLPSIS